jgi:molecular chaperone DnaK (HSP70)
MAPVESVLEAAGVPADAVGDIVLVGGSTRLLKVRSMLQAFFKQPLNLGARPLLLLAVLPAHAVC